MSERDPIEIRIRVSRRMLIALVIIFVLLPLVWVALQTLGGTSHS